MVDFETSSSTSEVSKSNLWKITSFSKNYGTSEGAVSHNVSYHQPLSPLLATKKGFMLIIILNNYQECPLPLTTCVFMNQPQILHSTTGPMPVISVSGQCISRQDMSSGPVFLSIHYLCLKRMMFKIMSLSLTNNFNPDLLHP